jgi:hypothetical protein
VRILEVLTSRAYVAGGLSLNIVAVDSTTIKARKGEIMGYDRCKRVKEIKVSCGSRPSVLSIKYQDRSWKRA